MRKRWIALGLAVVAAGAGVTSAVLSKDDGGDPKAALSTVAVDTGAVAVSVAATGTVQASLTRTLSFTVDGTVAAVNVRAGSKVKAGAELATVDKDDATDAVSDAKESLADAEDQLATAKASPSPSASVGVRAGQGGNTSVSGTDAIYTAQQRVNAAESALAEAKEALAGAAITAPIAGTIMSVSGQVGSQVNSGSTFITLADTYAMQVSASFPEADAGAVATGQAAAVTLADRVGEEFAAKVAQVDPVGTDDGTLVTYGVLLSFTKQPADLLVGQSASVEVTTGSVASTLRVPSTAVHDVGTVLVSNDGRTTKRDVQVGLRGGQYTQILSGLTENELVVRSW
ncbi:efflux RND transporter periplasmic adaptor subunit [Paractinoplanes durhamensis]|uniref:RND transporter n=1 Tax=Paractinoplanes durhamensis TaxID=113563 RepID=A0ABQ3Z4H8_9ACTN|nr:efflux RND transporter periplasmic adaptor subunit [Actinoplanes durhamensis]GIE04753.1 RND transporter [Actinoplanes durhamensis]